MEPRIELIRELIGIVEESGLAELTVESGEHAITVRTTQQAIVPAGLHGLVVEAPAASAPPPAEPAAAETSNRSTVVSPMVGVFYRSPSPETPAFVEVGATVEVGQTIGIVEAMKVFNEIPSDVRGTVVEIAARNQQLVQIGELLVVIEKS